MYGKLEGIARFFSATSRCDREAGLDSRELASRRPKGDAARRIHTAFPHEKVELGISFRHLGRDLQVRRTTRQKPSATHRQGKTLPILLLAVALSIG
jgi:hypothetical protein